MNWIWVPIIVGGALLIGGLLYWQLVIAEGTYFGPRVVAGTYDWVAKRYDKIKRFNPQSESWFIARPLMHRLHDVEFPLVLDVATGTGRVPVALLQEGFSGQLIGLDLSWGMLARARSNLLPHRDQVQLLWQDASQLPFDDGSFHAVTCLESLEFFPSPVEALSEMARVLAPGGVLLLTNRVGPEAYLLPGRAIPRHQFEETLSQHSMCDVQVRPWQVDYDLVVAYKEGDLDPMGRGNGSPVSMVRCPGCRGPLQRSSSSSVCRACDRAYLMRDGIICLASFNTVRS
jgi:ubiquinone/menaquinone biosynthesis C-methylase UbiE